ncbi:MAG TPA: MBL fold metallo-hydrolase [Methylomirabilota bacterium]|jgi:hydroxyacylglutathione hydrolase|nr:MBL fold metallo-hydrolase [Methylomirabilota bacterium]
MSDFHPPAFPETARLTPLVGRVLGLNPGLMTGPGTNTYLVGARQPLLIDTGAGEPGYVPLLQGFLDGERLDDVRQVLLTHRHVDHMGGVPDVRRAFPRVPVAKLVRNDDALPVTMQRLDDEMMIRGDGVTLHAVYTPGHASDHLCYYLEEERALFTGDLILGGSTTVIPPDDGDLGDYLASLRRVLQLDVQRIYPAHGPVLEPARPVIEGYIAHRLERDAQILDAVRAGAETVADIVARVYREVSPALHPVARLSVRSHLKKLELDGQIVRLPGDPPRVRLA